MEGSRLSALGTAIADPSRARILSALHSGRAHSAGELARWAGIGASTASRHLSQLVDVGLVSVEASGRFRHFRIASEDVADLLERIDSIELPETTAPSRPRSGTELSFARGCYDHLAGELGVRLHDGMIASGFLIDAGQGLGLTDHGRSAVGQLGIDLPSLEHQRRPLIRTCLDWTERRHHLGGSLGAALLSGFLADQWLRHGNDRRVLKVTTAGQTGFEQHFDIATR